MPNETFHFIPKLIFSTYKSLYVFYVHRNDTEGCVGISKNVHMFNVRKLNVNLLPNHNFHNRRHLMVELILQLVREDTY